MVANDPDRHTNVSNPRCTRNYRLCLLFQIEARFNRREATLRQDQNKPLVVTISDPHNVPEVFVTSVVNATLISDSSIAVTLGMRRMIQENSDAEPQETLYVVSRPVLTLRAAEELVRALSGMLARAQPQVRRQDVGSGTATPQ
jgi:hypothetical protein